MTDSDFSLSSVRAVIREELEPVKLAHRDTANAVLELSKDVQKLDGAINGNGRPGLREELASLQRGCKIRHGSGPPPAPQYRDDLPSYVDLEIERTKCAKFKWATLGKIVMALIAAGAIGGGTGWGIANANTPQHVIVPSPAASVSP